MCIELTLKETAEKVHVMKAAIVSWQAGCDAKGEACGSDVVVSTEAVLSVTECPHTIHGLIGGHAAK